MPSFETPADIFTGLSVFDSPKGSSNTLKAYKNIPEPVFQKKAPNNVLTFIWKDRPNKWAAIQLIWGCHA